MKTGRRTNVDKRPSFVTKKEAQDFLDLKRKYNDRIRKSETRAAQDFGTDRETIRRTGYYGIPMGKKLEEITSRREFLALRKLMRLPEDPKRRRSQKLIHDKEFKNTLLMILDEAYGPTNAQLREAKEIISHMTGREIIEFRLNNPDLVRDWFWRYRHREGKLSHGEAPPDDRAEVREAEWNAVMDALRQYRKG